MKKLKLLIFLSFFFFFNIKIISANEIYSIDINLELDQNGNGKVTEIWNMKVDKGTENYKPMGDLGNSKITNFHVKDEKGNYDYLLSWDINGSLNSKAYKNGINYTSDGLELCWGMSSYGRHTYTLTYNVSNMVYNTKDAQVLYWKFINDSMRPAPKKFSVTVSGVDTYSDTLDVWGYGYEGYAYVDNGKIYMSNTEDRNFSSSEYAVLLVKYPLDTFITDNHIDKFYTFDDFYNTAEEGSFEYNYSSPNNSFSMFAFILIFLLNFLFPIIIFIIIVFSLKNKFSIGSNYIKKPINMNEVSNFRDIPCDKDVFKAYFLASIYKLNSKKEHLLGAILLKWLRDDQVKIVKQTKKKLFGTKEITAIDLSKKFSGTNELESNLYQMMWEASKDGLLEENELKKWCSNNYNKFFKWFDNVLNNVRDNYITLGNIIKTEEGKFLKKTSYTLDDSLYEEAVKLAGLKKYLKEFSRIEEKQPMEVMLWQEYLIFAQIFGIAKEVSKQFKKLYPEIFENNDYHIDYTDILWINMVTSSSISSASSARSRAESYSSGGGGFSSGGGGGSSFGGGSGGGCR